MSATAQPWAPRLSGRMTVFSCVLSSVAPPQSPPSPSPYISSLLSLVLPLPVYLDFYLLRPVVSFSHHLHSHLYVLLLISVFSSYTNVFVFIHFFFFFSRCPYMLNEAQKRVRITVSRNTVPSLDSFFFFFFRDSLVAVFSKYCDIPRHVQWRSH